jgi:hypothetical protein
VFRTIHNPGFPYILSRWGLSILPCLMSVEQYLWWGESLWHVRVSIVMGGGLWLVLLRPSAIGGGGGELEIRRNTRHDSTRSLLYYLLAWRNDPLLSLNHHNLIHRFNRSIVPA